jgi:hypothetical protein
MEWKVPAYSPTSRFISYNADALRVRGVARDKVQSLVEQLVQAGALPVAAGAPCCWRLLHESRQVDRDALEAMARAEVAVVACTLFTEAHSEWHLTRDAVMALQLHVTVTSPSRLFSGRFAGHCYTGHIKEMVLLSADILCSHVWLWVSRFGLVVWH